MTQQIIGHLRCALMLVICIALLPACHTTSSGPYLNPEKQPELLMLKERADIIKHLGIPHGVRMEGNLRVYTYSGSIGKGLTAGISYNGISLSIGNKHTCSNTLQVYMDSSDHIVKMTALDSTPHVKRRLWPFN